jgi:hypothetical protein
MKVVHPPIILYAVMAALLDTKGCILLLNIDCKQ